MSTLFAPLAALARFDRPVGVWLLFWPCAWGLGLGAVLRGGVDAAFWYYLALCFIGSVAMRSAGCVYNDWCDRELDAQVARTANRPLAARQLTTGHAVLWGGVLLAIGGWVWWQLPSTAQLVAVLTLPLVALYPWLKRVTYWPQVFLGLTFNWGVWVGSLALYPQFHPAMAMVYLAAVLWTVGYDTLYAMQDVDDDRAIGIKSTAVKFGDGAPALVWLCYFWQTALLFWAGWVVQLSWLYFLCIALSLLGQLVLALPRADDAVGYGFRRNDIIGGLIAGGWVLPPLLGMG